MSTNTTPDREAEREAEQWLSALYDAIGAFQRANRLPGLQHAQMRAHLAEHLVDALLGEGGPVAALLAENDRLYSEADGWRESYRIVKGLSDDELNAQVAVQEATARHAAPCRWPDEPDCACDDAERGGDRG